MHTILLLLLSGITLAAAAYTHYRLPFHTANARSRWFTHLLLIIVDLAFGWGNSQHYAISGVWELLIFLSSGGVIHIPAVVILFIKPQQKKQYPAAGTCLILAQA